MVKSILKSSILRHKNGKKFRQLNRGNEANKNKKPNVEKKTRKKKEISPDNSYINYYLKEKINFLLSEAENSIKNLLNRENEEFYNITSTEIQKEMKYKQENRALVLIGLEDIINQLCENNKNLVFPADFIFSVIALFDYYLIKSEKQFNRLDMVKTIYACLDLIDTKQKLGVFNSSFFQKYINYDIEIDIIEAVDINLIPVKIFDFFAIFYLKITQVRKYDKKFLAYMNKFKKVFFQTEFYFIFHEHSKTVKPSINFVSCLLLTYEQTENMIPKGSTFNELFQFINQFSYSKEKYLNSINMIKESIGVYKEMIKKLI